MAAAIYNFEMDQGEDWFRTLTVTGLDMTGRTVKMQLRYNATDADPPVATATVQILNATTFTLEFPPNVTSAIGAPGADSELVHDIWVDNMKLWKGTVKVNGRISR